MSNNFQNLYDFNFAKSSHLREIAWPLKENFGVDFLSYRRFYKNGNLVYLINNQEWMEFSFSKGWINSESFYKRLSHLSSRNFFNYVWPNSPSPNDAVYSALHSLNIRNGIALYKAYDDYIEVFVFSSTNCPELVSDLYLNSLFVLDRFILYFREKLFSIIQNIDKKCLLKHNAFDNTNSYENDFLKKYLEQTNYKKIFLRINGKDVGLSMKEIECLNLLSQGKAIKEVARTLHISPRTVETHINNLKVKTDLFSTPKLIDLFFKERNKYQI